MTQPVSDIWAPLLAQSDSDRVCKAGFAQRSGFGSKAAILVIDAQNYMVGPVGSEAFDYPSSCGELGKQALASLAPLLAAARRAGAPVIYTRFELARDGSDMGGYRRKRALIQSEGWCLEGSFGAQIANIVAPAQGDDVVVKKKPSAFLGTPVTGMLIDQQIDTVIVTGGSTSNCVRATAVDAASLNFRVIVPADCVFDRIETSHRVALYDLDRQYGDVIWSDEAIDYFKNCEAQA